MKFSIKDFFNKCDKICSFLQIWSRLLMKSRMENWMNISCFIILQLKYTQYQQHEQQLAQDCHDSG